MLQLGPDAAELMDIEIPAGFSTGPCTLPPVRDEGSGVIFLPLAIPVGA